MILVDSSVWIDFFSKVPGVGGRELRRLVEHETEQVGTAGVVITEVLQGLTRDTKQVEQILRSCVLLEPFGFQTYREAAAMYRTARANAITPATADVVIAAIAVEHGAQVFTLDEDFKHLARFSHLQLYVA